MIDDVILPRLRYERQKKIANQLRNHHATDKIPYPDSIVRL